MEINLVSLFSGIMGFELGLEMAGFKFKNHYYSEIEPYAIKVSQRHYPRAINLGDVRKIDGKTLGEIDILTGGFPCQDISVAGKQKGLQGVRSGLFYEIVRIASDCRPRIMFLENVSNLLTMRDGAEFGAVLGALAEVGYDAEWHCVPASHVGAPHGRDRIWIVAYSQHERQLRCKYEERTRPKEGIFESACNNVPNPELRGRFYGQTQKQSTEAGEYALGDACTKSENVADTISNAKGGTHGQAQRESGREGTGECQWNKVGDDASNSGCSIPHADSPGLEGEIAARRGGGKQGLLTQRNKWLPEPTLCSVVDGLSPGMDLAGMEDQYIRVATGVPERVNQLKCLGNAVVPQVVEYIARTILIPILGER